MDAATVWYTTRPDKGVAKKEGCEGEGRELLITIYARFSIRDAWGILKDAVELEIKQREPHHRQKPIPIPSFPSRLIDFKWPVIGH